MLRGYVLNERESPMPYANVILRGTHTSTMTADDGSFVLPLNADADSILITIIGYCPVTLPVTQFKLETPLRILIRSHSDCCIRKPAIDHIVPTIVRRARYMDTLIVDSSRGITFWDSLRNDAGYPIAGRLPRVYAQDLAALGDMFQRATADTCCIPTACLWEPKYYLCFSTPGDSLLVALSMGCGAWNSWHNGRRLAGCPDAAAYWSQDLKQVLRTLFPDSLENLW
jgi:hypothetical protein